MTICYFGDYDSSYNRTAVIFEGLLAHGTRILEVNVQGKKGWQLYYELWKKHRTYKGKYDVLLVGFGTDRLLPVLARMISRKPVVWDPLFSLYDNWVFDRKLARPHSGKAYLYWFLDWLGCLVSDFVFLDTHTNATYFHDTFGVPKRKLFRVLVGADTKTYVPLPKKESAQFEVEFHGKYIPVQGADVLVRAAKLLEHDNVHVTMIGGGQEHARIRELASELAVTNVTFLPFLPPSEVVRYVADADACIGLLGDVPRVVRAIPNKLYEAAAAARVSISTDSTSLREVFTPGVDTVGVIQGDPESLAGAILELKNSGQAKAMGEAAHKTFCEKVTSKRVVEDLVLKLKEYGS